MGFAGRVIPLVILFIFVGVGAYIGYEMYLWSSGLADRGKKNMEKRNVTFTKDGMKVGVKEVSDEDYADRTQSYLVKAWNLTSFPAYKSKLGWMQDANANAKTSSSSTRPTMRERSRTGSSSKIH